MMTAQAAFALQAVPAGARSSNKSQFWISNPFYGAIDDHALHIVKYALTNWCTTADAAFQN